MSNESFTVTVDTKSGNASLIKEKSKKKGVSTMWKVVLFLEFLAIVVIAAYENIG